MTLERTLCILKPDTVEANQIGSALHHIEKAGFRILALQHKQLSQQEAEGFYAVHKARPFFAELVSFMVRSPVVLAVLERDNAVVAYRELMGETDPSKAAPHTLRKLFGKSIGENAVHGSDSLDNAQVEIAYFFPHLGTHEARSTHRS